MTERTKDLALVGIGFGIVFFIAMTDPEFAAFILFWN